MKNVIFIFLSFIAIYNLQAQSPNFEWVKSNQKIGWFGMTTATSTTLDTLGNVYLVGRFTGIVDFNPSPYYTTILTRDIDGYSSYIQKLDSNGNLIWVRALNFEAGGIGKIEIDKEGSLYIMGSFKDSVDIDPETNVHMLYSNGGYDAYILKISTNGNFIWAKSFGGIEDDVIRDIATDLQGNIYSHGSFKDTVDFDPGAGICIYGTNYSPPPSIHPLDNPFIQKLDKDGNFVWANTFICGEGSLSDGYSIDTDSDDNVYCAGYFFGSNIDFDPGAGVINPPSNNSSMYFVKLDSMGSFVWAKFSTKVGVSGHASPDAMVIDRFNNVFITGNSSLSIDFDPGLDTLLLSASTFIQKYNVNGDFLWAKSYGYGDIPHNITTDTFGNIYSIGSISDSTDLDPGPDTLMFYGNWAYLQKLNSNGDLLWGGALSGNIGGGGSSGYDIAVDIAGNIFAAGNYSGTIDFDPSLGVYNLMSINNFSASYILKLSQCKTL
ncbi:MAG: hypothetical protein KAG84_06720, partial [Bacteroidales bacterium]|nr:hypothetical protein [Bacteroidales bacterium]